MGTRSDVGIALKNEAVAILTEKYRKAFDNIEYLADDRLKDKDGVLYILRDVTWSSFNNDVKEILSAFENLDEDLYYIVEAYHDATSTDDSTSGCWSDNPWNLYVSIRVELQFEEQ